MTYRQLLEAINHAKELIREQERWVHSATHGHSDRAESRMQAVREIDKQLDEEIPEL